MADERGLMSMLMDCGEGKDLAVIREDGMLV